mgnify:CR=1 FL=1
MSPHQSISNTPNSAPNTLNSTQQPPNNDGSTHSNYSNSEKALYLTFFCLTTTFLFCHLPRIILNVYEVPMTVHKETMAYVQNTSKGTPESNVKKTAKLNLRLKVPTRRKHKRCLTREATYSHCFRVISSTVWSELINEETLILLSSIFGRTLLV